MKKIKSLSVNIDNPSTIYSEHSIYELTDEEMKKSDVHKRYLVDRTYSDYAMNNMDLINIIKKVKRESEYVYGMSFANTVEEAELLYKNDVLECVINDLKGEFETIREKVYKLIDISMQQIEFEEV